MKENLYVVISETDTINLATVTSLFQGYETRNIARNAWLVKAKISAKDFQQKIQGVAQLIVLPLDMDAVEDVTYPRHFQEFLGSKAA